MNDYKLKIDCDISPRELSYALSEFHRAPSGDGPLGFTWQDKPHRIVYDLIAAVKYYAMRVDELESRLEVSPLHNVDGIMARDATIKLQDERIAELEAERAERERQEPVAHEYQDRDGIWRGFIDQRHYKNTFEDGSWPIRALYADPTVAAPVRLTDEQIKDALGASGSTSLLNKIARAVETAVLRTNGFKVEE